MLEAFVRPVADVIEKVLHAVGILSRRSFTRGAWGETMYGAFEDKVLLIPARGFLENDLVVPDELVGAHCGDQHRNRNRLHRASRRVVTGTMIDAAVRIRRARGVGAQE